MMYSALEKRLSPLTLLTTTILNAMHGEFYVIEKDKVQLDWHHLSLSYFASGHKSPTKISHKKDKNRNKPKLFNTDLHSVQQNVHKCVV